MTVFTDFTPTSTKPFQFSPILDGTQHTLVVTWSIAGQRWYVNLYDQNETLIFYLPLIASPDGLETKSLTWDSTTRLVTITTVAQHELKLGTVVALTISNVSPKSYNGVATLIPGSSNTLTYARTTDPGGDATVQGTIGRDINLGDGYFTSTLVFRGVTQQFEVSP